MSKSNGIVEKRQSRMTQDDDDDGEQLEDDDEFDEGEEVPEYLEEPVRSRYQAEQLNVVMTTSNPSTAKVPQLNLNQMNKSNPPRPLQRVILQNLERSNSTGEDARDDEIYLGNLGIDSHKQSLIKHNEQQPEEMDFKVDNETNKKAD